MFACEFVTTFATLRQAATVATACGRRSTTATAFATLRQAATVATACGRRSHSNGGGRRSKCQCDANGRSKVKVKCQRLAKC